MCTRQCVCFLSVWTPGGQGVYYEMIPCYCCVSYWRTLLPRRSRPGASRRTSPQETLSLSRRRSSPQEKLFRRTSPGRACPRLAGSPSKSPAGRSAGAPRPTPPSESPGQDHEKIRSWKFSIASRVRIFSWSCAGAPRPTPPSESDGLLPESPAGHPGQKLLGSSARTPAFVT